MIKCKWLLIIIVTLVIISMLSVVIGCKRETVPVEEVAEEVEEVAEEVEEVEEVAEEEAKGVQPPEDNVVVKLVSWAFFIPMETNWDPYYAKFREKYPTIEIEVFMPTWTDHETTVKTGLISGDVDMWGTEAGALSAKFKDFSEPLDSYAVQEWGENWEDNFVSGAMEMIHWIDKDNTLALPDYLGARGGWWYNETMFDELGLTPPKTYDEVLQVASILKENDIIPVAHSNEAWTQDELFSVIASEFAGNKLNKAIDGEISWIDDDLLEGMTWFKKMYDDELFGDDPFTGYMYMDYITLFAEEKIGMAIQGNWHLASATFNEPWGNQNPETLFRTMDWPDFDGDSNTEVKGSTDPILSWSMSKDMSDEKKSAAWIVMKELTSGMFAQHRVDMLNWSGWKGIEPNWDNVKMVSEVQKEDYIFWTEQLENSLPNGTIKYAEIREGLFNALSEVAIGVKTPQEALESLEELSDSLERLY